MNCKDCGKDYTPLTCPSCGGELGGGELGGGSCPACSEGSRVTCAGCGQQLEIARVDAEMSEGVSPDGARPGEIERGPGETHHHKGGGLFGGETQAPEMADIEVAAGNLPPQPEPETPGETLDRLMGADSMPEPTPPAWAVPETMSGKAADVIAAEPDDTAAAGGPASQTPPPPPAWLPPEGYSSVGGIPPGEGPEPGNAPPPAPTYYPQDYPPPQGYGQPQGYPPPQHGAGSPLQGAASPAGQWAQQPQQQYGNYPPPPPGYGQQNPPPTPGEQPPYHAGNWPGYPAQPYAHPLVKAPLGGWMTTYFVFVIIGLVFSCLDIISNLNSYSPSFLSIILSAVLYILPAIMIIVCIARRDINFRKWFVFRAVVGFITAGLYVLGAVGLGILYSMGELDYYLDYYLNDYLYDLLPYGMSGYDFYGAAMGVAIALLIIIAVVQVAWYVAWLIYFRRSRWVAWAFDPRNNPPR